MVFGYRDRRRRRESPARYPSQYDRSYYDDNDSDDGDIPVEDAEPFFTCADYPDVWADARAVIESSFCQKRTLRHDGSSKHLRMSNAAQMAALRDEIRHARNEMEGVVDFKRALLVAIFKYLQESSVDVGFLDVYQLSDQEVTALFNRFVLHCIDTYTNIGLGTAATFVRKVLSSPKFLQLSEEAVESAVVFLAMAMETVDDWSGWIVMDIDTSNQARNLTWRQRVELETQRSLNKNLMVPSPVRESREPVEMRRTMSGPKDLRGGTQSSYYDPYDDRDVLPLKKSSSFRDYPTESPEERKLEKLERRRSSPGRATHDFLPNDSPRKQRSRRHQKHRHGSIGRSQSYSLDRHGLATWDAEEGDQPTMKQRLFSCTARRPNWEEPGYDEERVSESRSPAKQRTPSRSPGRRRKGSSKQKRSSSVSHRKSRRSTNLKPSKSYQSDTDRDPAYHLEKSPSKLKKSSSSSSRRHRSKKAKRHSKQTEESNSVAGQQRGDRRMRYPSDQNDRRSDMNSTFRNPGARSTASLSSNGSEYSLQRQGSRDHRASKDTDKSQQSSDTSYADTWSTISTDAAVRGHHKRSWRSLSPWSRRGSQRSNVPNDSSEVEPVAFEPEPYSPIVSQNDDDGRAELVALEEDRRVTFDLDQSRRQPERRNRGKLRRLSPQQNRDMEWDEWDNNSLIEES